MTCSRGCCPTPRDHWMSVSVAPSAMPSRGGEAARAKAKEARWDRDMDAYKRLRADGLQPKEIDGSADLERDAESRVEVETGQVMDAAQRAQYAEVTGDQA